MRGFGFYFLQDKPANETVENLRLCIHYTELLEKGLWLPSFLSFCRWLSL